MSKIHPTESKKVDGAVSGAVDRRPSTWTVWKRSSMAFQGTDGFSVYDCKGRLAFRVDNYSRRHKCFSGELVLMDGKGKALLTLKPQILSLFDRWDGYKGEQGEERDCNKRSKLPLFSMRRCSILQSSDEAEVFVKTPHANAPATPATFRTAGYFRRRCCKIYGSKGEEVARISAKKASKSVMLGDDVFSLVVQPGVDCEMIMAFVVIMDRICKKSYSPLMCS